MSDNVKLTRHDKIYYDNVYDHRLTVLSTALDQNTVADLESWKWGLDLLYYTIIPDLWQLENREKARARYRN